ncbi:bifunctional precorrin-2 dehydrogenase/sirohydrochlorin ferrochelatase [Paenibacillus sp. PL2-23]|uniref:precorrin-2 dehydrogenase/sirohydrochlorin ferrochelatase family protein n=1 Tax=Paenibacillus sp. PL2-23 TaxID=2100729 RepID=UPI0030FC329F
MGTRASNGYYPVALRLPGRRCVIAGGGKVAQRKLAGLLEAGADDVVLISPDATESIRELAARGSVRWLQRSFAVEDLTGAWLVVAATSDRTLNAAIAEAAERLGMLANVADDYERGSFITPAVIRRGRLLVSVTASGASPAFAKALKQDLEEKLAQGYEAALERLEELRGLAQAELLDRDVREQVLRLAAQQAVCSQEGHDSMPSVEKWLEYLVERVKGGLHNEQYNE